MRDYYGRNLPGPELIPAGIIEAELCTASGELASDKCIDKKLYPVNIKHLPQLCRIHHPLKDFDINHAF